MYRYIYRYWNYELFYNNNKYMTPHEITVFIGLIVLLAIFIGGVKNSK
jgi:hypothetical protein